MAVIATNGAVNLSTVNGFVDCPDYNLSSWHTTQLRLNTTRSVTLSNWNSGNLTHVGLMIYQQANCDRDIQITIKKDGVTQHTQTFSYSSIVQSMTTNAQSAWCAVLQLSTPVAYSVPSGAGWTVEFIQTGGTASDWYSFTSNGSAPGYFVITDNAVSFANGDTLIVKDTLTVDQTASIGTVIGTGETRYGCSILIASGGTLTWENPASASYTLTIQTYNTSIAGNIVVASYGRFEVGNSASRIQTANKAIIVFNDASTTDSGGFKGIGSQETSFMPDFSEIVIYGEIPTIRKTTLTVDHSSGSSSITTNEDVSATWSVGDTIMITKADYLGALSPTYYTISSFGAGNVINISPNLSINHKADAPVYVIDGYGVEIKYTNYNVNRNTKISNNNASVFEISGAYLEGISFGGAVKGTNVFPSSHGSGIIDDVSHISQHLFENCVIRQCVNSIGNLYINNKGLKVSGIYSNNGARLLLPGIGVDGLSGTITVENCVSHYVEGAGGFIKIEDGVPSDLVLTGNEIYNSETGVQGKFGNIFISGSNVTFSNNKFYGCYFPFGINIVAGLSGGGNKYDRCDTGIYLKTAGLSAILKNDVFGSEYANVADIDIFDSESCTLDFELDTPLSSVTIGGNIPSGMTAISQLKISTHNNVSDDDRNVFKYGELRKTKESFASPYNVVRTSGGQAWALTPTETDGITLFEWPLSGNKRNIPTGNVQNKTLTLSVWIKINSANFYAGTHTNPTLVVDYDNGTEVTAVATNTTDWQQVGVIFTPVTTFGQIKWYIKAGTDATGNDRIFYIDDMNVLYPGGEVINLSSLDLSGNAEPIFPPITTLPSGGNLWDESTDAHTIAGSYGALAKKWLTLGKFLGLK